MRHAHVWSMLLNPTEHNPPSPFLASLPPTYSGRAGLRGDAAIDCGNNLYRSLKCKCVYQVALWCRSNNTQWGTIVNQTFARRPIERAPTPRNETRSWNKSSLDGQYKFPSLSRRAWKRGVPSDARQCCISKGTLISCPKLKSTDALCQERPAPVCAPQHSAAANHWWGRNTQCGGGNNKHSLCFRLVTLETKKEQTARKLTISILPSNYTFEHVNLLKCE